VFLLRKFLGLISVNRSLVFICGIDFYVTLLKPDNKFIVTRQSKKANNNHHDTKKILRLLFKKFDPDLKRFFN